MSILIDLFLEYYIKWRGNMKFCSVRWYPQFDLTFVFKGEIDLIRFLI